MLRVVDNWISSGPLLHVGAQTGLCLRRKIVGVRAVSATEEREFSNSQTSSSGGGFVKPLSELYPRLPCRHCRGSTEIECDKCNGEGKLAKGGWHKKNPVRLDLIIGSKWTAMESTFGWRHFRVHSKRRGSGQDWFVEMSATCDETTRFWVNIKNLKERERWSMGWLQKTEILAAKGEKGYKLSCKACKGKGRLPCVCVLRPSDDPALEIIDV